MRIIIILGIDTITIILMLTLIVRRILLIDSCACSCSSVLNYTLN